MPDQHEDVAQQAKAQADQVTNYAKGKARRAAGGMAKKAGKAALKAGKAVASKGAAIAAKGAWILISSLVAVGWPVLLVVGVIILLAGIAYVGEIESRPVNKNIQSEATHQMNVQETVPEKPQGAVAEISDYNLLVNAFYMNYASQSYYRFYEGKMYKPGDPLTVKATAIRSNGDEVEDTEESEVKDSTNLEKDFFLSYELLWQLDEYLHDKRFKYPESFIKPLYYEEVTVGDKTTFKLKDLTNEKGELVVESAVYDKDGNRQDETTVGLWDYGLAPIISYETYLEDSRYEYEVTGKSYSYSYTLPEGAISTETFEGTEAVALTQEDVQKYKKEDEYLEGPKFVHMINQVTTFVGTFTPQIDYNWSRIPRAVESFTEPHESKEYTKEYDLTFEKMVLKTNSSGQVLKALRVGNEIEAELPEGCYRIDRSDADYKYVVYNDCASLDKRNTPILQTDVEVKVEDILVKKNVTEPVKVTVTENISYDKYLAEVTPQYRGKPAITDFKGGKYLQDYMYYYEAYVPETVINDLDLSQRVGNDPEILQEIVDEYQKTYSATVSGEGNVVGEFSQDAYNNAERYLEFFIKYGRRYGVDPYLLLAKAAQESSGDHESNLTGNAAIGLMQIEQPGTTVTQVSAYNHETGEQETVKICKGNSNSPANCLNVYDLETNIRVGAMQLAQRYEVFNGHHMLALQSYNFGEGGTRTTVRACGLDPAEVMKDQYNLDWMNCRQLVYENPKQYIRPNWPYKTFGDPVYIENVLKFYNNPATNNTLEYTDSKGKVYRFETSNINLDGVGGPKFSSSGSGASGGFLKNIGNFLKSQWDKLVSCFETFFDDIPTHFDYPKTNATYYDSSLAPLDLEMMETMIFAMNEQVNMDQIGKVTDEMWEEKFTAVFVDNSKDSYLIGDSIAGNTDPYFQGGARTPLPLDMDPIFVYGYLESINGSLNNGVALQVYPGTKIYAIYAGTVLKVDDLGGYKGYSVQIQHKDGLVSEYNNLNPSTVKLKEGDEVQKGDLIGEVAASKDSSQQFFHFELTQDGASVNPTFLFENPGGAEYFVPATSGDFVIPLLTGYVSCEWACYSGHVGIDLGNYGDTTTPVIASADGTVVSVNPRGDGWEGGYGNYVTLEHNINGQKFRTVYAHMHTTPLVKKGDVVVQGQKLGTMGNTGNSDGAHLHFEIQEGGTTSGRVNPRKYIEFPPLRVPW